MPRYEMDDKFWEIELKGETFFTRHGKIGSTGHLKKKKLGSAAEAKKEYERAIAAKRKEGYEASDARAPEKRNPKLEEKIIAAPEDKAAWAIYADWLQEQNEPRGELMALQLAGKDKEAKKLLEKNADYFLGSLAAHQKTYDGDLGNNGRSNSAAWVKEHQQAFLWRNGFIHRVRLAHDSYADETFDGKLADIMKAVLQHPSGRFIAQMNFNANGDPNEDTLDDIFKVIAKVGAPATLRKVIIGDNVDQISWYHVGSLAPLWKGARSLRDFQIEAGTFDVGEMDLPNLERAVFITGGLSKRSGKAIATAKIPKIERLEIYYGTEDYGGDCSVKEVKPLLERTDLKHLTYLGLKNAMFTNDIARALSGAKILKTLKTLDLSLGTMTDEGAEALAKAKDSLKHLETLDLTRNFLTEKGIAAVQGLAKKVITEGQEEPDEYDGETYYFVDVAE